MHVCVCACVSKFGKSQMYIALASPQSLALPPLCMPQCIALPPLCMPQCIALPPLCMPQCIALPPLCVPQFSARPTFVYNVFNAAHSHMEFVVPCYDQTHPFLCACTICPRHIFLCIYDPSQVCGVYAWSLVVHDLPFIIFLSLPLSNVS